MRLGLPAWRGVQAEDEPAMEVHATVLYRHNIIHPDLHFGNQDKELWKKLLSDAMADLLTRWPQQYKGITCWNSQYIFNVESFKVAAGVHANFKPRLKDGSFAAEDISYCQTGIQRYKIYHMHLYHLNGIHTTIFIKVTTYLARFRYTQWRGCIGIKYIVIGQPWKSPLPLCPEAVE